MSTAHEINFDGLVGNTHNYAGLSFGNVASANNKGQASSPKQAALQGLAKMKALADSGLKQGVLPPHVRPYMPYLRALGFTGNDSAVLNSLKDHREYRNICHSASNMWVANAATIAPSADTADGRVHFTPANLLSMPHRAMEVAQTARSLKAIFANPEHFAHHQALPDGIHSDEGAANHTRFCREYGDAGVHFFVYGKSVFSGGAAPKNFPARQTRESFEAIARLHGLAEDQCVFAQQNPAVIDAGVFHNDVISVGNRQVLFTHQDAFVDQAAVYNALQARCGADFSVIEVPRDAVPVSDAVGSYLFNSQLVSLGDQQVLIAPSNCQDYPSVQRYLEHTLRQHPSIADVRYFDVRQSMANGGGPACLRLRVVLTEREIAALSGNVLLTEDLYATLCDWVTRHYRDQLNPEELGDSALLSETHAALTELSDILQLPDLYA
ncbi:N-succinylarginine dihydrolase [Suttonella sp. R2A3]|uniref:N-succinylarginine dihydrolase n=1 Tax=Suttonella sp. R2A3 TaxID=2908648 RepID=UPI001F1999FA|nr:N-succinylarginine dihydrolase [Suttonella sp. R2A3]UJF24252.1 N-succinylarginine dihydrolase [Suttonella sp. R2A3]